MNYSSLLRKAAMTYVNLFPFYRGYIHMKHRFLIPYIKNKVVLEVGCGEGLVCDFAARYSKRVYGLDLNPAVLEVAKKRPNIEYVLGDATKLPFKNSFFDFMLCSDVLEHIVNDQKALKEMKRVLKKGGKIFISVPNSEFLKSYDRKLGDFLKKITPKYLEKDVLSKDPFGHVRPGYGKKDFEKIAKKFGFRILKIDYEFKTYRLFEFRYSLPKVIRFIFRPVLDVVLVLMHVIDKQKSSEGGAIFVVLEKK